MIIVDDVHKRYQTDHGVGKWVLQGVSFTIPAKTNVGLIGGNGAGKSTLLRIIGGVDQPTRGKVTRHCSVSWPMGFGGGLQGTLTGRQNAKFVCRIHGHENDIAERLAFIQEFAEIGESFDEPIKTYSTGMQARLKFAISLAFDFDVYISDELTAVGDTAFKEKAKSAFQNLFDRSGLIMVSHQERTLKEFCTAGIWLHDGHAHWFDEIDDALNAYRESQPQLENISRDNSKINSQGKKKTSADSVSPLDAAREILEAGISGPAIKVDYEEGEFLQHEAKKIGMELVPRWKLKKMGFQIKQNAKPIVKVLRPGTDDKYVAMYDLHSQCLIIESDNE